MRFPPELDAAIMARADADGITPSEVIRAVVHRWVHGDTPSVDEGYAAARSSALEIAHAAVDLAFEQLPADFEALGPYLEHIRAISQERSTHGKNLRAARRARARR